MTLLQGLPLTNGVFRVILEKACVNTHSFSESPVLAKANRKNDEERLISPYYTSHRDSTFQ